MIRAFKYRLTPTRAQERTLDEWLRLTRELFNAALQERRDAVPCVRREGQGDAMLTPDRIEKIRTFLAVSAETSRGVERDLIADCKADGDDPEQSDDVGDQRAATGYVEDAGEALAAYERVAALLHAKVEVARGCVDEPVISCDELLAALDGTP
jgi:hypothetical protein